MNKLTKAEVQEIPTWFKYFLIHVVKRCALIVATFCDEVKEADKTTKTIDQSDNLRYNQNNN